MQTVTEQPAVFESSKGTVERTRQMLLEKARRGENVWTAIVRFEIDITEADGDPECEQIVCRAYWEVHARWA